MFEEDVAGILAVAHPTSFVLLPTFATTAGRVGEATVLAVRSRDEAAGWEAAQGLTGAARRGDSTA